uniref:Uncharacterized protein n=1 Tax=Anguilla anguilla TaxID=7936 RepID=A0A0E9T150_ANGAN
MRLFSSAPRAALAAERSGGSDRVPFLNQHRFASEIMTHFTATPVTPVHEFICGRGHVSYTQCVYIYMYYIYMYM